MREFDVPLKEHDWAQKCCVDVKNIDSSKNLNGRCPLEISEGHTQDISTFIFHLWEPIWYFKNCKAPENPWQPEKWVGFENSTGDEMCYYINTEEKNPKYLTRSVIRTRCRHNIIEKQYTNEELKQVPELNGIELGFTNSSNDTISGYLDEIIPDHDKVSRYKEPENKINDSVMEISEDNSKDTQVDANSKYDVFSEYGEHKGIGDYEPDIKETIPLQDQVYPHSIFDDLYNQLELDKDDS